MGLPLSHRLCTVATTRHFISSRSLLFQDDSDDKGTVHTALNMANEDLAFRFLDMIPEVRNAIYSELLTLRKKHGQGTSSCWPQILSVSKQTYNEGRGILYGDNTFEVTMSINISRYSGYTALDINNTRTDDMTGARAFVRPAGGWPQYLLQVQRLRLDLVVVASMQPSYRNAFQTFPQNALYSLSCFLNKNDSLRALDIVCHPETYGDFDVEWLANYVWPMSRLFSEGSISVCGLEEKACTTIRNAGEASKRPRPGDVVEAFDKYGSQVDRIVGIMEVFSMSDSHSEQLIRSRQEARDVAGEYGLVDPDRDCRLVAAVDAVKAEIKSCKSTLALVAYASRQSAAFNKLCKDLRVENEEESGEEGSETESDGGS